MINSNNNNGKNRNIPPQNSRASQSGYVHKTAKKSENLTLGERFKRLLKRFVDFLIRKDKEEVDKKPILGYRGRQLLILVGVFGFAAFVGYNLLKYTILEGDKWRMLATTQQTRELSLMANRGTIYDANGSVLAQSSTVWNIILAPKAVYLEEQERYKSYQKKLERWNEDKSPDKKPLEEYVPLDELIADGLCEILENIDRERIIEECKDHAKGYYIVKRNVEKPEVMLIQNFMKENGIGADCVYTEQSSKRYYPNGSLASSVIGFTNFDGIGVYGLEAYYDEYLRGTDGKVLYTTDGRGKGVQYAEDYYHASVDGYSLVLTLDEVMQHYCEKYLEQCVSQYKIINRASAIMMNCKTGGIIAMATTPSYDLNNPSEIMGSYEKQQLANLVASGATDDEISSLNAVLREQQWKNKGVNELYYPGSVFKTVTCASALDQEVVSRETSFNCAGYSMVAGQKISCWRTWGHGPLDLQGAITASCNPSFIAIGQALGRDKFCDYFEAFGFTEKTGIDLPGEAQSLYVRRANMGPVDLAVSAFGQSNKITPIQMCTAFAAIVNGGYLVTPHLVDKILDSDGNVVETKTTEIKRQVISEETSSQMRAILETIVNQNGGSNAYIPGYRIGGKSGTAEKIDENNEAKKTDPNAKMTYVSTFAAAVPMDDPQIVMLVMADTPTGSAYYGSTVTAPVISSVFNEGLEHMGIYPTYTAEEQEKMDAVVPNVIGNVSINAESYLVSNGFKVRFVGNETGNEKATAQIPPSGTSIPKGSTVVVYFGDSKAETGKVPNVKGMSVAKANEAIVNAGFNIKISGGAAENANAVAVEQSLEPGLVAYKGSVVEVTFMVDDRGD
ncbi:MAG: PASTA domain-containing protein [Oscillospiraceae bacterium]|nr:PASTA domain-containing protein [Oscillospiraceae bacterium]